MITNFEEITKEISEKEKNFVVPKIVEILKSAKGKKNKINSTQILFKLKSLGIKTKPARIRVMIHHIRNSGKIECLLAFNKGYYVSDDVLEVEKYIKSLIQRSERMSRIANKLLTQKLNL